jgi:hypothetical protein
MRRNEIPEVEQFSIVYVTWVDSVASIGWIEENYYDDIQMRLTETAGMLLRIGDESVAICLSRDSQTESVNGTMEIPICAIQSFVVVAE